MEFHRKLNCFTKYLNDYFYFVNNTIKSNSLLGGYHITDFEPLTFEDIVFNVPFDCYMSAVIKPNGIENQFILQLLHNEYSIMRSDYQLENEVKTAFSSALQEVKSLMTGDNVKVSYTDLEFKVYRDNFSQNGKVRTISTMEYLVTFE